LRPKHRISTSCNAGRPTGIGPRSCSGEHRRPPWPRISAEAAGPAHIHQAARPLLDEPAAALDASAEHDLFERYATSAGQAGREDGGITVLISHRFSTVRMADLIAVLDHGQLTECGTHRELMTARGLYAELFTLQARAYH